MKHNLPTTENHFKSFGGEALTRLLDGAIAGMFLGFCAGIIFCLMTSAGSLTLPGLTEMYSLPAQYFLLIVTSSFFGAVAGGAVGIGVPRLNPRPSQGLVKKWKAIVVRSHKKDEVVYIPEETRKHRVNNPDQSPQARL